jgi:hypothetical protein
MAKRTAGRKMFAVILETTELSEFHKLTEQALSPTLAIIDGLLTAKFRPLSVREDEPEADKAK